MSQESISHGEPNSIAVILYRAWFRCFIWVTQSHPELPKLPGMVATSSSLSSRPTPICTIERLSVTCWKFSTPTPFQSCSQKELTLTVLCTHDTSYLYVRRYLKAYVIQQCQRPCWSIHSLYKWIILTSTYALMWLFSKLTQTSKSTKGVPIKQINVVSYTVPQLMIKVYHKAWFSYATLHTKKNK